MTGLTRIGMIGLSLALAGLATGCEAAGAGSTGPDGDGEGDEDAVVEVQLTASATFSPAEITIAPGTTVRWVNDSNLFHTVTPDGHDEWSSRDMPAGEVFEHTFTAEGTYPYYCEPHLESGMTGTVVVESSGTDGSGTDGY